MIHPPVDPLADYRAHAVRTDNAKFVRDNRAALEASASALRFSGRAFLALGASQLVFQASIVTCLDEFAFGVFLLDAAHKLKGLLANTATRPVADELCAAMKSIADTHSIFAWVTSGQVAMMAFTYFGIQPKLRTVIADTQLYQAVDAFADQHKLLVLVLKFGAAIPVLRYGGFSYAKTKITYWTRAFTIGVFLLTEKIKRILGHHPRPLIPRSTAKEL